MIDGQHNVQYTAGCAVRWLIMQHALVLDELDQATLLSLARRVDRYFNRHLSPTYTELYLVCTASESWLELSGESIRLPRLKEEGKYVIRLTTITCGSQLIWQQPPPLPSVKK